MDELISRSLHTHCTHFTVTYTINYIRIVNVTLLRIPMHTNKKTANLVVIISMLTAIQNFA